MAAPYNNLRSKLNRAICAWLISQDCGTSADVLPANSASAKTFPNTVVRSRAGRPEMVLTGNYRILVHITVRGQAIDDSDDLVLAQMAFDTRVAKTNDAMMQTADEQTLRFTADSITTAGRALAVSDPDHCADMADFTCLALYDAGFGDGEPQDEGFFEEILAFEAVCCASAIN